MSKFSLRPEQEETVSKVTRILFEHNVCLLAAECRTGKSLMSLCAAQRIGSSHVLFITPKKAIPSVIKDYKLLVESNPFVYELNVVNPESLLSAQKKADDVAQKLVAEQFPTLSMKGLKAKKLIADERSRQLEIILPYLSEGCKIDTIIVDECHRQGAFPKPSGSQRVIKELAKGCRVLFLSGTPSPESYSQLFHIFDISENSPFKEYNSFYKWAHEFVNIGTKMINGVSIADYTHADIDKIRKLIEPITVTLTQQECGFEVKVKEKALSVLMNQPTYKAIQCIKRHRVATIVDCDGFEHEIVAETAADLLNKMHQLAGGTIKIEDEYYIIDDSKAKFIVEKFKNMHIAIFYVYKAERTMLMKTFGDRITESPEEFQSDNSKVFIGQIRSVREGIRLDSAECSIFYSTEYSYVSYAQGIQRIVSKEREEPAVVYFLTSQCKIEKLILDAVHNKEDFTLQYYIKHQ